MAYKDGSSSGSWTGFRFTAHGAVGEISVVPVDPPDGTRVPSAAVPLSVEIDSLTAPGIDVQIQIASDAGFTSIVSAPTMTNKPNGRSTVITTGLPTDVQLYWRARGAPTGTSDWSPWYGRSDAPGSDPLPMLLYVDLDTGRAYGQIYLNVAPEILDDSSTSHQIDLNVGPAADLEDDRQDHYIWMNIGHDPDLSPDAVQSIYGEVNTETPVPHVWFLWKPFGFANDEVWAYGHGLGNPQSEYTALLKIDPAGGGATVTPSVSEWYLQEAQAEAYTANRTIFPGLGDTPPRVDMQVEIVRWDAPVDIVPEDVAVSHEVYVEHTGGESNHVLWLMYPTIPVGLGNVGRSAVGTGSMRLRADLEVEGIQQLYFFTEEPDYVIAGGRPERPALFGITISAEAELGEWETEDDLAGALDVDLGATFRWIADEDTLTPRPDLGTGASVWEPSVGSTSVGWKYFADSAPYVDPTYVVQSRMGERQIPAMVFPGDAFAELTDSAAAGPNFTVAMVAVLHAAPTGRGTLVSTFREGVPNPEEYDWEIYAESGKMRNAVGGLLNEHELQLGAGRPVIVVSSVSPVLSNVLVVDQSPSFRKSSFIGMADLENRVYLGRSWRPALHWATMDVLDVAWWDEYTEVDQLWSIASKLDGIYGVTG